MLRHAITMIHDLSFEAHASRPTMIEGARHHDLRLSAHAIAASRISTEYIARSLSTSDLSVPASARISLRAAAYTRLTLPSAWANAAGGPPAR